MHSGKKREFKDTLFDEFAPIGKAVASGRRLELLDLLAQGERSSKNSPRKPRSLSRTLPNIFRRGGTAAGPSHCHSLQCGEDERASCRRTVSERFRRSLAGRRNEGVEPVLACIRGWRLPALERWRVCLGRCSRWSGGRRSGAGVGNRLCRRLTILSGLIALAGMRETLPARVPDTPTTSAEMVR